MNIITTEDQLHEMVNYYLTQDAFAYDVETVGERRGDTPVNEVLWITFATHGRCDVIPMGHPNGDLIEIVYPLTGQGQKRVDQGLPARPSDYSRDIKKATYKFAPPPEQLYPGVVFKALKPLMFNPDILIVGHNLVFDLTSVAKYYDGEFPTGPYFDTMIASFLYDNANKNKVGLDDCLKREFGYEMVKGVGKEVEKHSFNDVAKYAYLDAKYTFLLWKAVKPKLEAINITNIMNLEMDVLAVLCDMKLTGAMIDIESLNALNERLEVEVEEARAKIFRTAGRPFNINSNAEKQEILYGSKKDGNRGLKPTTLTTRGETRDREGTELSVADYSVSADALESYRGKDDLVDAILEYSDLNKLMSTYITPYLGGDVVRTTNGKEKIEHKDTLLINGRLHGSFIQHGAETGRFSSRNPNLQNVPAPNKKLPPEKDYGTLIRNLFYAPPGYKLVVADYSQIEPRIIASMSEDPIMMKNYLEGGDIYTTIGDTMGVDRKAGKVLVLSIAYGVGPDKIASQIGCTVKEAKALLDDFGVKFASINKYKRKVISATRAKKPAYIHTLLGRRRYIPDINSSDMGRRASAERQAFNTRIQGSAADIIKLAMVRAHAMIPKEAKIILTVHDELVVMTPDHLAEETMAALKDAMENIEGLIKVPLIADAKIVQRWGEAK